MYNQFILSLSDVTKIKHLYKNISSATYNTRLNRYSSINFYNWIKINIRYVIINSLEINIDFTGGTAY